MFSRMNRDLKSFGLFPYVVEEVVVEAAPVLVVVVLVIVWEAESSWVLNPSIDMIVSCLPPTMCPAMKFMAPKRVAKSIKRTPSLIETFAP